MIQKTDTAMYKGRAGWYAAAFGVSIIGLAAIALFAGGHRLAGMELAIFRTLNDLPATWHTPIEVISEVGLWLGVFVAVCAIAFRLWRLAWRLVVSMGAGYASALAIKHFIDRPRPEGMLEHLHVRMLESGPGFPSAHATIITITMLTLLPYLPRVWRWVLIPLAIVLVAASRVYLGVHSPLDVLAGIALGVAVVSAVRILPQAIKVLFRLD